MFTARDFGPPGSRAGASEGTGRDGEKKLRKRRGAGCQDRGGGVRGTRRVRQRGCGKKEVEQRNGKKWEPCFSGATKRERRRMCEGRERDETVIRYVIIKGNGGSVRNGFKAWEKGTSD